MWDLPYLEAGIRDFIKPIWERDLGLKPYTGYSRTTKPSGSSGNFVWGDGIEEIYWGPSNLLSMIVNLSFAKR